VVDFLLQPPRSRLQKPNATINFVDDIILRAKVLTIE
jgi:hypothetical protein